MSAYVVRCDMCHIYMNDPDEESGFNPENLPTLKWYSHDNFGYYGCVQCKSDAHLMSLSKEEYDAAIAFDEAPGLLEHED